MIFVAKNHYGYRFVRTFDTDRNPGSDTVLLNSDFTFVDVGDGSKVRATIACNLDGGLLQKRGSPKVDLDIPIVNFGDICLSWFQYRFTLDGKNRLPSGIVLLSSEEGVFDEQISVEQFQCDVVPVDLSDYTFNSCRIAARSFRLNEHFMHSSFGKDKCTIAQLFRQKNSVIGQIGGVFDFNDLDEVVTTKCLNTECRYHSRDGGFQPFAIFNKRNWYPNFQPDPIYDEILESEVITYSICVNCATILVTTA